MTHILDDDDVAHIEAIEEEFEDRMFNADRNKAELAIEQTAKLRSLPLQYAQIAAYAASQGDDVLNIIASNTARELRDYLKEGDQQLCLHNPATSQDLASPSMMTKTKL